MKNDNWVLAGLGVLAIVLLAGQASILKLAAELVIKFEGFRSKPYWDVNRYSWGYGTRAPGSTGTISKARAFAELMETLVTDYNYLQPMISRKLAPAQWAALLSFSYNTGRGNADNLVTNINSGNDYLLGIQWNKYIYSDGKVNPVLVDRRAREWQTWLTA